MPAAAAAVDGQVRTLAGMESRLAVFVGQTRQDVAHAECFDDEQRAEVYAILEAIESDTNVHKKTIKFLEHRLLGEPTDA
jgi:hypothetical protein